MSLSKLKNVMTAKMKGCSLQLLPLAELNIWVSQIPAHVHTIYEISYA